MSEMREAGLNSKSWPFEEARRVLKRYQNAPPEKGHVIFETGQAYNIACSHIANIWTAALSTGLQVDQSAIALSGCYKV